MLGQLFHHGAVGLGETQRFHHQDNRIDPAHCLGHIQVQAVVHCIAVIGLKTGGVDKNHLFLFIGVDAVHLVAGGLCFFAGDADFLAD